MTEEEKYEQSKLIALPSDDSEYAFQLLYDRYRNRIYKLSLRFLKSSILAQEVVQDLFLKLWFSRKNIDPDKPLEAWLFTIAKNALINRFKKLVNEWNALTNCCGRIMEGYLFLPKY
jgi:RNA polymerase sigma-70 factor (ECF subfamily)